MSNLHCLSLLESSAFEMRTWVARADLHADLSSISMGTLMFTQADFLGSPVRVTGSLTNLIPNTRYHGFHVHMFGLADDEWNCSQAGDHCNPYGTISFSSLRMSFKGEVATPYFFDSIGSFNREHFVTYILQLWRYLILPNLSYSGRKNDFLGEISPTGVPYILPILGRK